jgi:hypothetical protein
MNYPFKEFAKVGILRQTGKAKCKKMAKNADIYLNAACVSLFWYKITINPAPTPFLVLSS